MIAACDTFRSGAVEQLRTHTCRLKALHPKGEKEPEKVMLYDKGYGKDAAAVSMEAINLGKMPVVGLRLKTNGTTSKQCDNHKLTLSIKNIRIC